MFPIDRNRKRTRQTLEETTTADDDTSRNGPLKGVVACLTGFLPEEKERLHCLIHELGGT